jgi:regulator of chromosome condensation
MVRARAKKPSSDAAQTSSDAPVAKVRRTNAVMLEIPSLPTIKGNLLVCGQNDVGQLGLNPDDVMEKTRPAIVAEVQNIVDVKAGGMHSLCLTKTGEIWSFGCNVSLKLLFLIFVKFISIL